MIIDVRQATYLLAVASGLEGGRIPEKYITVICPECGGSGGDDFDFIHQVMRTGSDPLKVAVVIACEGYWVVNPSLVGVVSDNWQDWTEYTDESTGVTITPDGAERPKAD